MWLLHSPFHNLNDKDDRKICALSMATSFDVINNHGRRESIIFTSNSMLIFNVSLWGTAHLLIISLAWCIKVRSCGCDQCNFITSSEIMWSPLNLLLWLLQHFHMNKYFGRCHEHHQHHHCRMFTQFIIHMQDCCSIRMQSSIWIWNENTVSHSRQHHERWRSRRRNSFSGKMDASVIW